MQEDQMVSGLFASEDAAHGAVARLRAEGFAPVARPAARERGAAAPSLVRRGLLTGAAVGGTGGALLEATVLAFPPAAAFVAGGTAVAAAAGMIFGAGAGGVASAIASSLRPQARSKSHYTSVQVRSAVDASRARARTIMRAQGALETHDADDETRRQHFMSGFAQIAPRIREQLAPVVGAEQRDLLEMQARYGWQMAHRPDFDERGWDDAEPDLASDWQRRHADVPWSGARRAVEIGWRAERQQRNDAALR